MATPSVYFGFHALAQRPVAIGKMGAHPVQRCEEGGEGLSNSWGPTKDHTVKILRNDPKQLFSFVHTRTAGSTETFALFYGREQEYP